MCGETYVGALFSVRGAKRHGEMPCVHSVSPLVCQHVAPLVTVVGKSYNIHRHQHVVATRLNFVFLLLTKRATDSFFDLLPTPSQGRTLMIPGKELRAWSTPSGDVPGSRKRCFCPCFDLIRIFHLSVFCCLTVMIIYFAIIFLFLFS